MADTKYNSLDPELGQLFSNLEEQHNLPSGLLKAVAYTESRFKNNAKSPVGASGMFQFMPATAKQYGVDTSDPVSSAKGAAKMYSDLLRQNKGDLNKSLAGYNWGQGNVNKKGMDNAPKETTNYISQITKLMGDTPEKKNNEVTMMAKQEEAIPPEAYEAYEEYMAQQSQSITRESIYSSMMPIQEEAIPPEAYEAYEEYMAQQGQSMALQQPMAQSMAPQQPMAQSMALQQPMAQSMAPQQPMAQPMAPQQPIGQPMSPQQLVAPVIGQQLVAPVIGQQVGQGVQNDLNTQASAIAPVAPITPPNEHPGLMNYNKLNQFVNKGLDYTPFFNSLNEVEKKQMSFFLQKEMKESGDETGILEHLWQGVAGSAQSSSDSFRQAKSYIGSKITGDNTTFEEVNRDVAKNKVNREINELADPSKIRTVAEFGGDLATSLAIGGGIGGIVKAGASTATRSLPGVLIKGSGAKARAADLALAGAGSSMLNPVINKSNTEETNYLQEKAKQAGVGAVAGAVLGSGAEKIGKFVGKHISAIKGDYTKVDKDFIKNAEDRNIPWTVDDLPSSLRNQKLIDRANKSDSNIMNETRINKQVGINDSVEKFQKEINKADSNKIINETGLDKIINDTTSKYNSSAKELAEKINKTANNDPNRILTAGAQAKHLVNRSESSSLYSKAEALAPAGTKIDNIDSMKSLLKNMEDSVNSSGSVTSREEFKKIRNDFRLAVSRIEKDGKNSYQDFDVYMREYADLARESNNPNTTRLYTQFRDAISKDRERYVDSLPDSTKIQEYKKAYGEAQKFNKDNIQDIDNDQTIKNIFNLKNNTNNVNLSDDAISDMIQKGQTEYVRRVFDKLPEQSKIAVVQGTMHKIFEGAKNRKGDIRKNKLYDDIKSYRDKASNNTPLDVIFKPDEKKSFDNLTKVINGLNLGTGYKGEKGLNVDLANPTKTYKSLKDFMTSKFFITGLTNPAFKKYMTLINNSKPGTPAYVHNLGQLTAYITSNYTEKEE